MTQVVAIFGPPGAGKTTTATAVAAALGANIVSSGDVARRVDPEALKRGEMADRGKLAVGFEAALRDASEASPGHVVVDGLPRDPGDVRLLPDDTVYILINCDPSIAIERQLRRGRPGDENPAVVAKRTHEQRDLMQLDDRDGWAYELAGYARVITTERRTRQQVIDSVLAYVQGQRSTVG